MTVELSRNDQTKVHAGPDDESRKALDELVPGSQPMKPSCLWTAIGYLVAAFMCWPVAARADRPNNCDDPAGDFWYECLGAVRAGHYLVAELRAGGEHLDHTAHLAGVLRLTDAIEPLRALLRTSLRTENGGIAQALVDLGDTASAPAIVAAARAHEHNHPVVWERVMAAMADLGSPEVVAYARDFISRFPNAAEVEHEIPMILEVLRRSRATDAVPALRRWNDQAGRDLTEHLYDDIIQTRRALGDRNAPTVGRNSVPLPPVEPAPEPAARLLQRIDAPEDEEATWIAASQAIELGVPGAPDRAEALMRRVTRAGLWAQRYQQRAVFVDRAVARLGAQDPRWAMMLLDASRSVRERALFHVVRLRPAATCDVVAGAISGANQDGGEHALLALTGLGNVCQPTLERIARDTSMQQEFRQMAIEVLGMLKAPSFPEIVQLLRPASLFGPTVARAREAFERTP